jgi:hypothetical protein
LITELLSNSTSSQCNAQCYLQNTFSPDLIALLIAVVAAVLPFVLLETVGERLKRNALRKDCLKDLISELESNQIHQSTFEYMLLEERAFVRFRRLGFLFDLDEQLRKNLVDVYSFIHAKNDTIAYHRVLLARNREEDKTLSLVAQRIPKLTAPIDSMIGAVLRSLKNLV